MKTKIAINGFGRIGRNAFKLAFERPDLEVVAVNDLTDTKTLAYLLKHDSNYGAYQHEVDFDDENIIVDGQKIKVLAEKDPAALPWGTMGVEVVIESTGRFTKKEDAELHIKAGAKRVVISGPSKSDGVDTIVLGANEDKLPSSTPVISNASCTTNSLGAVMAVLDSTFGVEKSMLTTVHSYTASQALQDAPNKDVREGRNAAENIVPTTTGAAIAVTLTLPQLAGKFDGLSIRVPTQVVSLSDITVLLSKDVTVEEVNEAFKKAASEPFYQGILGVSEEPLVSSDYIGDSRSGIVDLLLTKVVGGNLVKVMVWYDNEWGYSNRLVELTADVAKLLNGAGTAEQPAENSQPEVQPESRHEAQPEAAPDLLHEPEDPLLEPPHDPHPDEMGHGSLEHQHEEIAVAEPPPPYVSTEVISSPSEPPIPTSESADPGNQPPGNDTPPPQSGVSHF
ncbi:MAG: gap, Glyceraldehyde-3-phosphate dehydrogenase [Candidatus Saccharibacteria bacterium]|nr:gap, Glyceraldehyde-3-phosphate dehydrogenase [Candidatus Saccharibacteria bacterium]